MSGGRFDYKQHSIQDIIDVIKKEVDVQIDCQGAMDDLYSNKTLKKFNKAIKILEKAYVMAHRIDYLLSGDDGEETFNKRWKEELEKLK